MASDVTAVKGPKSFAADLAGNALTDVEVLTPLWWPA